MQLLAVLALAGVGTAFVLPDQQILLEQVLSSVGETASWAASSIHHKYVDAWLSAEEGVSNILGGGEHPPHHGLPHHPHDGHQPNETIYQLISKSKYTTKLFKLISEDEELVTILNGTAANHTLFAPTDRAFEKIPEDAPEPSKEMIKKTLLYHIVPGVFPARRVLGAHTVPTLLREAKLGRKRPLQRLSFQLSLYGLTVNFKSRIIAVDFPATNGVIHGIDSLIIPPPEILDIIVLLPTEFSTLELGLTKTGLLDELNKTDHLGATFFAPSNLAFRKLGTKINSFLFSQYGLKYLKALLKYHVVFGQTLYSTAYYKPEGEGEQDDDHGHDHGLFHVDLPTLLEDKSLGVDIARQGPFVLIKINGFYAVTIPDGIAEDGVIHVVSNVLIPPKKLDEAQEEGELEVDDLIQRLEPYVDSPHMDLK